MTTCTKEASLLVSVKGCTTVIPSLLELLDLCEGSVSRRAGRVTSARSFGTLAAGYSPGYQCCRTFFSVPALTIVEQVCACKMQGESDVDQHSPRGDGPRRQRQGCGQD